MNKYADEFYATFQELARKYSAEKVWQDVIYACALTQSVFLRSQDTVSYTHLDVYKRQGIFNSVVSCLFNGSTFYLLTFVVKEFNCIFFKRQQMIDKIS